MKVWHTADWHLGKRLHEQSLLPDQALFFDWLVSEISARKVDVLLVSGDVFDAANPPTESRTLYYNLLAQLSALKVQVVITGGNHDSPSMLNAPQSLLKQFRITVVGDLPENLADAIIPLGPEGAPEAVVAAIPFIRDSSLRQIAPGQNAVERTEAIQSGLREVFHEAGAACAAAYPGIPSLAMGHLYATGADVSESEREIQVGNLAGVDPSTFPDAFAYVALGHIHKPQPVAENIRYSGSPIPLSFSERDLQHRILEIDIEANQLKSVQAVWVPTFRKLVQVAGTLEAIQNRLGSLPQAGVHPTLVEARLIIEQADPQVTTAFREVVDDFNRRETSARIVKQFIQLTGQQAHAREVLADSDLDQLKPDQVFEALLASQNLSAHPTVRAAFDELLQVIQQDENA